MLKWERKNIDERQHFLMEKYKRVAHFAERANLEGKSYHFRSCNTENK